MSRSTHLDLQHCTGPQVRLISALEALERDGWDATRDGMGFSYCCGEPGDWDTLPVDQRDALLESFRKGERVKKSLGIALNDASSEVGVTILDFGDHNLTFWILDYRSDLFLPGRLVDCSYWLRRLIPPLLAAGFQFEAVHWRDEP